MEDEGGGQRAGAVGVPRRFAEPLLPAEPLAQGVEAGEGLEAGGHLGEAFARPGEALGRAPESGQRALGAPVCRHPAVYHGQRIVGEERSVGRRASACHQLEGAVAPGEAVLQQLALVGPQGEAEIPGAE